MAEESSSSEQGSVEMGHPFSADRPIQRRDQDLLGRARFAEALADAIAGWTHGDSLVIGLHGPWGMGKSSIKNMALDRFNDLSGESKPMVVEFNPWEWSAQEEVASAFFRGIGGVLGREDKSETRKRRAAMWRALGAYFYLGSSVARGVRWLLSAALLLVGLLGLGWALPRDGVLQTIFIVIGALAIVASGLFAAGGKVADSFALALTAAAEAKSRSLPDVKSELTSLLRGLGRPIVVVIDDVDRLTPEEIRLVFQLVKANADFPNLVYVLLFDPTYVDESLKRSGVASPEDFREKVIQVGFDVPQVEAGRVHRSLFEGLNQVLTDEAVSERFDRGRWARIFIPGLSPYFENLRDVRRFLSTFSFHVSLLRSQEAFEVNPVDLVGLEVLRVFEPVVYRRVAEAKSTLTSGPRGGHVFGTGDQEAEQRRELIHELLRPEIGDRRSRIEEIVKELFPPAAWALGGSSYAESFEEQWLRELRVCHPSVFDRYFLLAIPEGDISQGELDRLRSLAGDKEGLVGALRDLNERGLLGVALDRLEAYKQHIDIGYAVPFVTALMDIGDDLPEGDDGFFSIDAETHAGRIMHWYLKQEPDAGRRADILKEAIQATSGLFLPVREVSMQRRSQEQPHDEDLYLVDEGDLGALQELCVERIRKAAESGELQRHTRMKYILYRWKEWAGDEATRWVETLIASEDGLLAFLAASMRRVRSLGMGDYAYAEDWEMDLKEIVDFVSIDRVSEEVRKLEDASLTDEQRGAVEAFRRALVAAR